MKLSEDSLPDIGLLSNRVLLPSTQKVHCTVHIYSPAEGLLT